MSNTGNVIYSMSSVCALTDDFFSLTLSELIQRDVCDSLSVWYKEWHSSA